MLWLENKDIGRLQLNLLFHIKIINKTLLEEEQWKIKMDKMSVWTRRMNNLLLNMAYGEDSRNVLMRSFGREFQKVIILKLSKLRSGPMLKTERITICQPQLAQTHSLEHLDLLKLLTKLNQYLATTVTSISNKNQTESISENQLEQISIREIYI